MKEPGLRYEVAVSIIQGDIVWVNGPFACGVYNDWTIFNQFGLKDALDLNERVEADDGYRGGDPEYCKTPSGVFHDRERQAARRRVMGRQETVNKKLKEWQILNNVFRHDIKKHSMVFRAIVVITQVRINNGEKLYSCLDHRDRKAEN